MRPTDRDVAHRAGFSERHVGRIKGLSAVNNGGIGLERFAQRNWLRPNNFEDAILRALDDYATSDTNWPILVPPGIWPMTRSLRLLGYGPGRPAPRIVGAGRGFTQLQWPDSFSGLCVDCDGWNGVSGSSSVLLFYGGLEGMTITAAGAGQAVGLRIRQTVFQTFRDLSIRNFSAGDGVTSGVGLWIDGNRGTSGVAPWVENVQNTLFDNVLVNSCVTGARVRSATQTAFRHCQINQCTMFNVMLEGDTDFTWESGMIQSGNPVSGPYVGCDMYAFVTVGVPINTGSGASQSAAVGGLCTVSGLAGMTATSVKHWLRLPDGLWRIDQYVDAATVKIQRPAGTPQNNLAWEEWSNRGGNRIHIGPGIYHEVGYQAFLKTTPPWSTYDEFHINGVTASNTVNFAELDGTSRTTIDALQVGPSGKYVVARNCGSIRLMDGPDYLTNPERFDLDAASLAGLVTISGGKIYAGSGARGP